MACHDASFLTILPPKCTLNLHVPLHLCHHHPSQAALAAVWTVQRLWTYLWPASGCTSFSSRVAFSQAGGSRSAFCSNLNTEYHVQTLPQSLWFTASALSPSGWLITLQSPWLLSRNWPSAFLSKLWSSFLWAQKLVFLHVAVAFSPSGLGPESNSSEKAPHTPLLFTFFLSRIVFFLSTLFISLLALLTACKGLILGGVLFLPIYFLSLLRLHSMMSRNLSAFITHGLALWAHSTSPMTSSFD